MCKLQNRRKGNTFFVMAVRIHLLFIFTNKLLRIFNMVVAGNSFCAGIFRCF